MKIVVIGKNGQLGRYLQQVLGNKAIYLSRQDLDMANSGLVYEQMISLAPDVVINASAYTDTSRAEIEPGLAYAVNAASVAELARATESLGATLIHVSTDYVFDGEKTTAYTESDAINPLNVYGASKYLGESLIKKVTERHIIIRTSWVFSEFGANFVKTIGRLAHEKETLEIVHDQLGCPTYAGHLAMIIAQIVQKLPATGDSGRDTSLFGLYHYADAERCSWYDFAQAITKTLKDKGASLALKEMTPVSANDWPSRIQRPQNGELATDKMIQTWGIARYDWQAGLDWVIEQLMIDMPSNNNQSNNHSSETK